MMKLISEMLERGFVKLVPYSIGSLESIALCAYLSLNLQGDVQVLLFT